MNIFHDIARRLSSDELEKLSRFHMTRKPLPAEVNHLPMGFLACVGVDEDLRVLHVLSPFGKRVAMAAEQLADESAAE